MLSRLKGAARRVRTVMSGTPVAAGRANQAAASAASGVAPGAATGAALASPIERYLASGRMPWSDGYTKYKNRFLAEVLADGALLDRFERGKRLPDDFGPRLDERAVEYPWVLSRLRTPGERIVDAGSTFSTPLVLDLPFMRGRDIVIYTLATDVVVTRPGVRWVYGDLRTLSLADEAFDAIACISTLEHVGMGQSFAYSAERPYPDAQPSDALTALREMRRILRPGGRLLLTIPFGRREDHGWLQQFDAAGIHELIEAFDGDVRSETYFRYRAAGWQITSADECADARYFNIHATPTIEPDGAAAARAVCCLELVRP
ncbi:MAG: class I SAM-dependent methyltransferase [Chloroflexi bacterium]|nr:class I SAM-dependent methyltransferase [Chloroflexota bacterium]